jgi:hypothetical protein
LSERWRYLDLADLLVIAEATLGARQTTCSG